MALISAVFSSYRPFQKIFLYKMVFRAVLNAILDRFPLQNGFLDTDIGKTALYSALFSQLLERLLIFQLLEP